MLFRSEGGLLFRTAGKNAALCIVHADGEGSIAPGAPEEIGAAVYAAKQGIIAAVFDVAVVEQKTIRNAAKAGEGFAVIDNDRQIGNTASS